MYGNPMGVRVLARKVSAAAEQTRGDAARGAQAVEVGWQSVRAGKFRAQLREAVGEARVAAAELDELAKALTDHASAVEHELALIAAAEKWLHSLVAQTAHEAHQAADWLARQGANVVQGVVHLAGAVVHGAESAVSDAESGARQAAEETARRADQVRHVVEGIAPGSRGLIDVARAQGWRG